MIDIRKISIGQDYKNDAMHYIVGQPVLDKTYIIHLIQFDGEQQSLKIWIEKDNEVLLWKEFNSNMPSAIEYNINF